MRGYEVYLPLKRELRQWSDRKKMVEVPLINSYIFVRFVENERKAIYEVNGVVGFVNDMGKPAVISEREMENMRRAVDSKADFEVKQGVLHVGEAVRITSGPLAGVEGHISEIKGDRKLHITISEIGYTLIIDIRNDNYEKIV